MRNGPNPLFKPIAFAYPMDGDGMIHAVYFDNGRARYRNRFVETRSLAVERRAGMVAPDEKAFAYIKGRKFAPKGAEWDAAVERWRTLPSDAGAKFDRVVELNAAELAPFVTWGTNPGMVVAVTVKTGNCSTEL